MEQQLQELQEAVTLAEGSGNAAWDATRGRAAALIRETLSELRAD